METMILLTVVGEPLQLFDLDLSTIVFTLINTGIIVLAYRLFLHKPVMVILEKRNQIAKDELDSAAEANKRAATKEEEYKALLANSKTEANKIISAATAKARDWEEEIIAEAKKSAEQIRQRADEEIARERKRAINEVKDQITEIVIMAAGAVAEKEINEADNAKLIESFLVNADS